MTSCSSEEASVKMKEGGTERRRERGENKLLGAVGERQTAWPAGVEDCSVHGRSSTKET